LEIHKRYKGCPSDPKGMPTSSRPPLCLQPLWGFLFENNLKANKMDNKTQFKETKQRLEKIIDEANKKMYQLKKNLDFESLRIKNQCIYDLSVQNWRLGYLEALNIYDRGEGMEHFMNLINSKLDEEAQAFKERSEVK